MRDRTKETTKEITIKFDEESLDILYETDLIHRESLINYAVRLLKNTDMYKSLSVSEETPEDTTQQPTQQTQQPTQPKENMNVSGW